MAIRVLTKQAKQISRFLRQNVAQGYEESTDSAHHCKIHIRMKTIFISFLLIINYYFCFHIS
jgi:hypothetical protein